MRNGRPIMPPMMVVRCRRIWTTDFRLPMLILVWLAFYRNFGLIGDAEDRKVPEPGKTEALEGDKIFFICNFVDPRQTRITWWSVQSVVFAFKCRGFLRIKCRTFNGNKCHAWHLFSSAEINFLNYPKRACWKTRTSHINPKSSPKPYDNLTKAWFCQAKNPIIWAFPASFSFFALLDLTKAAISRKRSSAKNGRTSSNFKPERDQEYFPVASDSPGQSHVCHRHLYRSACRWDSCIESWSAFYRVRQRQEYSQSQTKEKEECCLQRHSNAWKTKKDLGWLPWAGPIW